MAYTRSKNLRIIKIGSISLFALIIIAYALFRSFSYARGPQINIFQPLNGSAVASSTVNIIGRAVRVNALSLNGRTVFIDEQGNFNEVVIIFPGINTLTFDAHDQFGREKKMELQLVGTI